VALKLLRPELAAVLGAERFLAESRTTARLQHPHILPLLDSGMAGALPFYVMPRVEGESLDLSVWSEEAGDWVAAEEPGISRGTVDLIYLAVRLALVEVLTHGKRPPLLFDDPFITFDDRRRAGAMALLRELSTMHQVILFTCSAAYDGYADRVITLPDRGAVLEVPATAPPPAARPAGPEARPVQSVGPLWEHTND